MPTYRVYCYDGAGKLWVSDSIEADGDEAAMDQARAMKVAIKCEVWQRDRLVGTIENRREPPPASDPASN